MSPMTPYPDDECSDEANTPIARQGLPPVLNTLNLLSHLADALIGADAQAPWPLALFSFADALNYNFNSLSPAQASGTIHSPATRLHEAVGQLQAGNAVHGARVLLCINPTATRPLGIYRVVYFSDAGFTFEDICGAAA